MEARIVLVTCSSMELSITIARELVGSGLAACVNLVPGMQSVYRWQGKIEQESETLLVIKTSRQRLAELEREVLRLHPYDTPEFMVLAPEQVNTRYLEWLVETVKPAAAG